MSARFSTTRWSLVLAAGRETAGGRDSLAKLCQSYWRPLYAYVRRRGYSPEDAQDLTQAFFARLMEKHWVAAADQARGRFRSFLLAALNHFLADEWDRERAQKRGSGAAFLSLDLSTAEVQYAHEPIDMETPERIFERRRVEAPDPGARVCRVVSAGAFTVETAGDSALAQGGATSQGAPPRDIPRSPLTDCQCLFARCAR